MTPTLGMLSRLSLLTCLILGCSVAGACAQQPSPAQTDAIRQSCRGDYQSHCAGVSPGGSAALQCLKDNMPSLSRGCQTAVGAMGGMGAAPSAVPPAGPGPAAQHPPMTRREEVAMLRNACAGDFRAHCPGVGLGGGRALACLADHRESLSPPCREALTAARGPR